MTLVARFKSSGNWCMIGDLLLSHPSYMGVHEALPMISREMRAEVGQLLSYEKDAPVRLCQKLALLAGGRVAIGWAGKYLTARSVIRKLRNALEGVNDLHQLEQAIRAVEEECWGKVQLLGMAAFQGAIVTFDLGGGGETKSSTKFAELTVIGSGDDFFLESHELGMLEDAGDLPREIFGFLTGIGTITNLMAFEIGNLTTLRKAFGGGYEFIFRSGREEFAKVQDVLFCIHDAIVRDGQVYDRLRAVYRYGYHHDLLLIRSLDWSVPGDAHDDLHVIPPVDFAGKEEELDVVPRPKYDCDLVVQILVVKTGEHTVRAFRQITRQAEMEFVFVREEGTAIEFRVGDKLMEPLVDRVKIALGL